MRIAFITPEYPGRGASFGIGRYTADLATGLTELGHDITVFALTDAGAFRIRPTGGAEVPAPCPKSLLLRAFTCRGWLDAQLEAFAPDVVETSNWGGLRPTVRSRAPLVVRLSTPVRLAGGRRWDPLREVRHALERQVVRRATRLIADSACMADVSARLYGRRADFTVPHGFTGAIDGPGHGRSDALFVGRCEPRKGIDTLLAAWSRSEAPIRLHIVGSGHPPSADPRITVHGPLDDERLRQLRARCALQIVPSRFESFGLVVLEAWAASMAVLASDAGALPEVVGEAGVLFPADDAEALARTIASLHGSPERIARLALAGRQRLIDRFSRARWLADTLAAYDDALATRDAQGR